MLCCCCSLHLCVCVSVCVLGELPTSLVSVIEKQVGKKPVFSYVWANRNQATLTSWSQRDCQKTCKARPVLPRQFVWLRGRCKKWWRKLMPVQR